MLGFTIKTHIYGIPCKAEITHYEPAIPSTSYVTSGDPQPGQHPAVEFQLLSLSDEPGCEGSLLPYSEYSRIQDELIAALERRSP